MVNIYKSEPAIGGGTVKYTNQDALIENLEYDIEQKKSRNYVGLICSGL